MIAVEATTLVLPLLVVTIIDETGTFDATHQVANVFDFISNDDFNVSSLSKKENTDNITTTLAFVDPLTLIRHTTMSAKSAGVVIVVKTLEIWPSLDPASMSRILPSNEAVASTIGSDFR